MCAKILVSGIVQGVGFRPFIYRKAIEKGLVGYVRNRKDAIVEIIVEGRKPLIEEFIGDLIKDKPPLAQIYKIKTKYNTKEKNFKDFKILQSSGEVELLGSLVPSDVSICNDCLLELRDPKNKRFDYFFITCTNCGPRYTIINKLPYDRSNTTMKEFQMCKTCNSEYIDPINRRFHAQTVACKKCGPEVYLSDSSGDLIDSKDPIRDTGKLLEDGSIVAIKGNGGFHIATSTTKSKPIAKLRKNKYRKQKPFALMSPNLNKIESFAELNSWERELLTSYRKPIILLKKSEYYYLSNLVSPELNTVGVMLPCTGLHTMLFDKVNEPAFVMTSANQPSEPIITKNFDAIEKLSSTVDYFLLHNRLVAQRCDDSVVRFHGNNPCLIRRSRGYTPEPIILEKDSHRSVLAVGGELNVTSCILTHDKAFISQHIGNVENLGNLNFLKNSINHLLKLINSKIEIVACDFHPNFATTKLAKDLSQNFNCPVVPVQHHHAHGAALMAEWNVEEIIVIACDGFGYGCDRTAWGGEILHCNADGFQRVAHLENQPMVGGDLATYYPLRMALGILYGKFDLKNWLIELSKKFPHGKKEVELIINQLKKGAVPKTSSCGRILDSISAILEICYERTYEGEPAIKLESAASKGKDILNLSPKFCDKTLDTTFLVKEIFMNKDNASKADLAYSAESYLARGLAQLAIEEAELLNVKNIGFSGGVAYNEHITTEIRNIVENADFKFLVHKKIPAGDGGTSFGQAIVVGFKI